MSVSKALENSAASFCEKYACDFDFESFRSKVEEFTFLRPNGGWIDVYKKEFERVYMQALEAVAEGVRADLDGEAMIDDFEYTLIRPYVNEGENEIRHKPYVGMDRLTRLEYLVELTEKAPSNLVDLYSEKYKSGRLSIRQMGAEFGAVDAGREQYVEIAACIQGLEKANEGRSVIWRTLHPFRNNAEKKTAEVLKKNLIDGMNEGAYEGFAKAAQEPFYGHQRVNAVLAERMSHEKEELSRLQKMSDVLRESLCIKKFDEKQETFSARVEQHVTPIREKQF